MGKKVFDQELLMQKFAEYSKNRTTELRNEIVEMNLGLVGLVVKEKFYNIGVEYKELLSLGYFGLINAVENYDMNFGTKFSTYAKKCIICYIASRMYQVIDFKSSNYVYAMLRYKKELEKKYDLNLEENISELEKVLSSDDKTSECIKLELSDYLKTRTCEFNEKNVKPYEIEEDIIDKFAYREQLQDALDRLSPKQRKIIELHYGYNGKVFTYQEIAQQFGVSRQYIDAEDKRILTKLRRKIK